MQLFKTKKVSLIEVHILNTTTNFGIYLKLFVSSFSMKADDPFVELGTIFGFSLRLLFLLLFISLESREEEPNFNSFKLFPTYFGVVEW